MNGRFLQCKKLYIQYAEVCRIGSWTFNQQSNNGLSEVGTGAGERVGGMVNRTNLASGSIAGPGAGGCGRSVGAETSVHKELAEVGGF